MIQNHLKIAFRFFIKNKLFTGINVLGLSVGITAFILLINYVAFERSYDAYLPDANDLYRVTLTQNLVNNEFHTSATNHPSVGPAMLADLPEVENFTRIVDNSIVMTNSGILSHFNNQGEKIKSDMRDGHIYFGNNEIISNFRLKILYGNPINALLEPNTIILSSGIATRFFGNDNPLGKTISLNGKLHASNEDLISLKVTGIFEDIPKNTHLPIDMVISWATIGQKFDYDNAWGWPNFYTYVKLKPGSNPNVIESRFPAFVKKYLRDHMNRFGYEARFGLQPVRDIHLKSNLFGEISANNNESTLYFLTIVAVFIICIALINFINLSTAKSMDRAREVGIKKVVGANRGMLIRQFLLESLLINFIAMVLSICLVIVLIPSFNTLIGYEVLHYNIWLNPQTWFTLVLILLSGGLLAGLYPAFVLSDFIPVQILKGNFQSGGKGLALRKFLVVFQFVISIALVAGTYIVYNQFSFMQNEKLGFDANHTVVLTAPTYADSITPLRIKSFKDELLQNPAIKGASYSNEIPGKRIKWANTVRRPTQEIEEAPIFGLIRTDHDFFKTYDIQVLAGRDFMREDFSSYFDENGPVLTGHRVIINKSAARMLGFQNPEKAVGESIIFLYPGGERTARVIGVVDDYHQHSLQYGYRPILFMYFKGYDAIEYVTVNISGNVSENVAMIETKYNEFFPDDVFNYFFMNEFFNRQYQEEDRFGKVFLWFSALAIFIAALGLFGLGSYAAMKRTREISVRKVLGANLGQALIIVPAKLLGLVLVSGAIALPLVYLGAYNWLNNYAFKVEMNIWMFIVPLLMVVLVAILSVSIQSIKAALVNPVDALRND
tara:strand:+ start:2619 stop:5126 length:2508 start_codon:yes stop_codon:yes gene_type:complete